MRLFVASDLPADLRTRLASIQKDLRALPVEVRWVRPEGIHLTFFFLGGVEHDRLDAISGALREAAEAAPGPFRLHARGVGVFPGRGRPRVIWAGIEGDLDAAARLKAAIDSVLSAQGFVPEARAFHPHLTLGRVREGQRGDCGPVLAPHARVEFGAFEVDSIVLFESQLGPGGARYTVRAEAALAPSGGAA